MEDEREQTPNEPYEYRCYKCETRHGLPTREAALAYQAEHRREQHSGMTPLAGDEVIQTGPVTQPPPEVEPAPEENKQPAPTTEEPIQPWQWIGFAIIVLIVLNFLFGK
ncbi:hypothetical protein [Streptomyces californicus]|uniref:hypothetical protein n=1 Tax=Streptomyces californicus TaxID=67351 RepID=UPI003816ECBD